MRRGLRGARSGYFLNPSPGVCAPALPSVGVRAPARASALARRSLCGSCHRSSVGVVAAAPRPSLWGSVCCACQRFYYFGGGLTLALRATASARWSPGAPFPQAPGRAGPQFPARLPPARCARPALSRGFGESGVRFAPTFFFGYASLSD